MPNKNLPHRLVSSWISPLRNSKDGTIRAVAVNADGAAPGTPPGGISVISITP